MVHTFLVADDCSMVRRGISQFLNAADGLQVICEAESAEETLRLAKYFRPDVIIIEPNFTVYGRKGSRLPEMELCRSLKGLPHSPSVLIYTGYDDPVDVAATVLAGAGAYVHKGVGEKELASALRGVLTSDSEWIYGLSEDYTRSVTLSALKISKLSRREKDILPLVLRRYSSKEIAEELHISTSTVHNHIVSLLRKLDCRTRTNLYEAWRT